MYDTLQPTDCSLPGSFVSGDLQVRILDWVVITFSIKSSIKSAKTRPGANCGLYHEHLIAEFELKLKKIGKTTRPFRYDPNQIPYEYTMEVMNRFKGSDLVNRMPEELGMEVPNTVQEVVTKTIPKKKKWKKAKWLSEEALQLDVKRNKRQGRKERIYPMLSRVSGKSKEL